MKRSLQINVIFHFLIPVFIIPCLASCFNIHEPGKDEIHLSNQRSAKICKLGEEVTAWFDEAYLDVEDFSAFAEVYCDEPYQYERISKIDTTGDGSMETIKVSVNITPEGCEVRNEIRSGNEVLWFDKMTISHEHGRYLFGQKNAYDDLYPLSAFYLGMVNSSFMDELDRNDSRFDFRKKHFLNELVAGNHPLDLLKAHNSSLSRYLDVYTGKYIFALSMSKRDVYIWDADKKSFVPLYLS